MTRRGIIYPREIDSLGYHILRRFTSWGMIPWGDWLAGVWYPAEIASLGYDTQGDWLTRVWYHRESDSPGYDTRGSQIFGVKIWITLRILNQNRKYLTHWSVAKASSNYEKNWRSKILLDCPFNDCTANCAKLQFSGQNFLHKLNIKVCKNLFCVNVFYRRQTYKIYFHPL